MQAVPEPDAATHAAESAAPLAVVIPAQITSPATSAPHIERGLALAELILARSASASSAGSRLPTERQLSIDLGVTRSSVRSALALLEAQGRISREVGRGTFLRDAPRARPGPAPQAADFAPADVMTIRRLLEPPAMVLVVAWATAADLEDMNRCLVLGDQATTFDQFEACDLELHRTIIAASHSPLLVALYSAVEAARHGQVWGDLKRRSSSAERRSRYQEDHRAIVAALRRRDSADAVEAMRRHLARVHEHLNVSDPAAGLTWR